MLMTVSALKERGVKLLSPESVFVGLEVELDAIAPGVVIHPGCRLLGKNLSIGPGSVIGKEATATVDNCQLGHNVSLAGGYFKDSVFLDGSGMGSGAHVRAGCLLEEQASGAHSVGFKQTIFLPYVTAGSLVNFCDALMAGGRSRKEHSEIGSSYVHFNFTPHGDKATPSLIGDIPRGVMLDQDPIFLGGQGGLVGPVQVGYGTVIGAGSVQRKDILAEGQLVMPPAYADGLNRSYHMKVYGDVDRIMKRNLAYVGNLYALLEWYCRVRDLWLQADRFGQACQEGALGVLDAAIAERTLRIEGLVEKVAISLEQIRKGEAEVKQSHQASQEKLLALWPAILGGLSNLNLSEIGVADRRKLVEALEKKTHLPYVEAVAELSSDIKSSGTDWLQAIVDEVTGLWDKPES